MSKIPVKPRLRKDLEFVEQTRGQSRRYTVKDPVAKRYFEIGEAEYLVMRLLDGTRDQHAVCDLLPQRSGIDPDDIKELVTTLDRLRLLESSAHFRPTGRVSECSFFRIRLRLFNPERLISILEKYTGFLFTLPSLAASLGIIGLALYLTAADPTPPTSGIVVFQNKFLIVAFYLISAIMMTLHEFGHAIACRRFNGEVNEMGVMLLCLLPCFYTDVSDIYLMKKKAHRIAVIAAGPMVELTLWAICAVVYHLHATDGLAAQLLYVAMLTSGLKSLLINFNPFIKVDGYYLLEELLNVSNLMAHSRELLASSVKNLTTKRRMEPAERATEASGSKTKNATFLVYGIISISYSIILISIILSLIVRYFFPSAPSFL